MLPSHTDPILLARTCFVTIYTTCLKSTLSLYYLPQIHSFSILLASNPPFLYTTCLKSTLSLYYLHPIHSFSILLISNPLFLYTTCLKSTLSLYYLLENHTFPVLLTLATFVTFENDPIPPFVYTTCFKCTLFVYFLVSNQIFLYFLHVSVPQFIKPHWCEILGTSQLKGA